MHARDLEEKEWEEQEQLEGTADGGTSKREVLKEGEHAMGYASTHDPRLGAGGFNLAGSARTTARQNRGVYIEDEKKKTAKNDNALRNRMEEDWIAEREQLA